MEENVFSFLQKYQIVKGSEHTHTSFIKPTGAFYIQAGFQDQLFDVYKRCMREGEMLYVTEKHRDIGPVLIDLDFRYEKTSSAPSRFHTTDDIYSIVDAYLEALSKYVVMPEGFQVYVMEKPGPVIDKNYVKDGIHIVIPDIVTRPSVQYVVRQDVLKVLPGKLAHLDLKNAWTDVIDEAVIEKNNWMMYGSRKPNGQPYTVTHILNVDKDLEFEEAPIADDHSEYVEVLSIRNKFDPSDLREEYLPIENAFLEDREKQRKKKLQQSSIFQLHVNMKRNSLGSEQDLEYVKKLVAILSDERANDYHKWIRLGWCLRNIDHRLLDAWIEFSRRSPKFEEGTCEHAWNFMKDDGLNIGSLHLWAKEDNPEQYREIVKHDLFTLISKSTTGTHTDIAAVVYQMYKYEYVCVSIKNNLWYEFKNHRWQTCDSGFSLRAKISNEVCKEYYNHSALWSHRAATENDEEQRKTFGEKSKKLSEIALKLKTTAFKDNIIKECREVFYIEKFEEKLDSRCHLIGFENGVFDLESYEFREGRPEDYISFSAGINYTPYDADSQHARDIHEFLRKVFPKPHMKEYFLLLLSSILNGNVKEERFHISVGGGCHQKDTPIMMYDGSLKMVQDIVLGELLMGDDSTPRLVKELFRGESDMYEIKPVKGDPFVVNGDHVLVLKASNGFHVHKRNDSTKANAYRAKWIEYTEDGSVLKACSKTVVGKEKAETILAEARLSEKSVKYDDMIQIKVNEYNKLPKSIKEILSVYRPDLVKFDEKEVKLDPYLLGYWLGDGNAWDPAFTTADIEVLDYIKEHCDENGCKIAVYDDKGAAKTYGISGKVFGDNKIRDGLKFYDLFRNKHVPVDFKVNSRDIRMQVLAGIIDSDGHYQPKMKQVEITLKSEKLIDDVIWLARSLGLSCYKSKIKKKCHNNGKVGEYFQTILVGKALCEIPVKVPRKKPSERTCPRDPLKLSFKVKQVEDGNYYGFELDGNHRYLMGDFIVTHNSNGKSKCVELFESSFGDYCCKLPITLLTQKRAASNAATSEIARTKGKRFAMLQEPSEDEKLNVGLMKELTGGDKIMARQLYKEPVEFKPQFKMMLACNHLPNVPANDNGTWRRIRVIEFTSKFTENPDPENPNEFEMDTDLSSKFPSWKETFMSMLITYYKKYVEFGNEEPDEVLACTRDYQRNNDVYLDFVEQEFQRNDMAFTSISQVTNCFKSWLKDNNITHISIKKRDLQTNFLKSLGKTVVYSGIEGFKGWQFKNAALNIRDELENK